MVCSGRLAPLLLALILLAPQYASRAQDIEANLPETTPIEDVTATPDPTGDPATPDATDDGSVAVGRESIAVLFRQANPLLWPLVLCSVVTVGFALERLIALRRSRVMPKDFVERFLDRLSSGKLDRERALELCRANESTAARVFGRVVHYWGQPAVMIREALGHDGASEILDLKRNVRVLNATATLAPLLGLLGTVVGMIEAFEAVSGRSAGGKGEALAHGISVALVATAIGLGIAILSVTAYYYLLNRIDILVRDLDREATRVIDLVAGDAGRPLADRRGMGGPSDLTRHEAIGR